MERTTYRSILIALNNKNLPYNPFKSPIYSSNPLISTLSSCFLCTCVNGPWDLSVLLHLDLSSFCSPHKTVWFHPAAVFASKAMMSSIDQIIKHDAKAMPETHKCLQWLKPPYFYLTSSAVFRYPWQWDSDTCVWRADGIQTIKYAAVQWFGPKDPPFYCHPLSKVILV